MGKSIQFQIFCQVCSFARLIAQQSACNQIPRRTSPRVLFVRVTLLTPTSPPRSHLSANLPTQKSSHDDDDSNDDGDDNSADSKAGKAYRAFSNAIRIVLKEDESALSNRFKGGRVRAAQHQCLYCSDENADVPFLWQPTQQQQQQALMGSNSGVFEGEITAVTKSKASVRWSMDSS